MPLHDDEVRRIADLAHLELDDAAVARLAPQLATILEHVASVARLDVAGVPEMAYPAAGGMLRRDETSPSLPVGRALEGAPAVEDDHFVVPRVLRR